MTTEAQSSSPSGSASIFNPADLVPFFAVACMLIGYIMYTGAKPHTLTMTWGKQILMPVGNFLLFAYLLLSKVLPMLRTHLKERRAGVAAALQSFDQQSGNIADRFQEIKAKLDGVEDESKEIIAHAETQAADEKTHALAQAEVQAEAHPQERWRDLTNYEHHRIQQRLRRRLIDSAFARAEELLNEHINDDDQARLQTNYLKLVDKIS